MYDNLAVYKVWAPDNALWTEWVKPVLFVSAATGSIDNFETPEINYFLGIDRKTGVIIDLPGKTGVEEGVALARNGWRPVPLYNGVDTPYGNTAINNVRDIVAALFKSADILSALTIAPDAPPAFLLDSNRMKGLGKLPGNYDNRWCIFPQDMPSASFMLNKGINKIVVRTDRIQDDLSHILYRYQEQGIKIYECNDTGNIRDISVKMPSQFKSLVYRFKVILGLTRNAAGGFGGQIPDPQQSTSGHSYHGIG